MKHAFPQIKDEEIKTLDQYIDNGSILEKILIGKGVPIWKKTQKNAREYASLESIIKQDKVCFILINRNDTK